MLYKRPGTSALTKCYDTNTGRRESLDKVIPTLYRLNEVTLDNLMIVSCEGAPLHEFVFEEAYEL